MEPFRKLIDNLSLVADYYAKSFSIDRTPDWYLIKLQEELGELSSAYLKISNRARPTGETPEALKRNLEDELADVLAMTLLFAQNQGIDPIHAIQNKWYPYLEKAQEKK